MTQPYPLREQLKALEHLQELDLKIDGIKKKRAALPAALKTLEDNFLRLNTTVANKTNAIGEIEKLQRQTSAALDLNKDRLARANTKLESVQNSQEFQAANKEIDQLKKLNGNLEEQLKKHQADVDLAQKDLHGLSGQFESVKKERDAQAEVLAGQVGQLDKEIATLAAERAPHVAKVEPRLLSQYDRVRVARGGIGFVPAMGGRCSGCNMMVPPQLYNEVQKASQVHQCPSCHRILFVPQPSASSSG